MCTLKCHMTVKTISCCCRVIHSCGKAVTCYFHVPSHKPDRLTHHELKWHTRNESACHNENKSGAQLGSWYLPGKQEWHPVEKLYTAAAEYHNHPYTVHTSLKWCMTMLCEWQLWRFWKGIIAPLLSLTALPSAEFSCSHSHYVRANARNRCEQAGEV